MTNRQTDRGDLQFSIATKKSLTSEATVGHDKLFLKIDWFQTILVQDKCKGIDNHESNKLIQV